MDSVPVTQASSTRAVLICGVLAGALVAGKLALLYGRPLCPRYMPHDDLLFVRLAKHILYTGWLGPYDELTLVKGPFYSLFLAGNSLLHVPLLLTQELLYVIATGVLVLALSPLVRNRFVLLVLFAACLFNPGTYSPDTTLWAGTTAVVTRESLYTVLSILVCAGMIGLWANRDAGIGCLLEWAAFLGGVLGAFWLTREEGAWLVPALLLMLGPTTWHLVMRSRGTASLVGYLGIAALPLVMWGLAVLAVATLNYQHYGVFTTNELGGPFKAAYGALTRVEHPNWVPNLPVPRAVRMEIYRESPAFRELQGRLEEPGSGWFRFECDALPQTCGDIGGGHLLWAIREFASRTGHHGSARTAADYYQRIADEVNQACDAGRLHCGPVRATIFEPVRWFHIKNFPSALAAEFLPTITFSDVFVEPVICGAVNAPTEDLFSQITNNALGPFGPPVPENTRTALLHSVAKLYQRAMPRLAALALLGYLTIVWSAIRGRTVALLLPGTALLLAFMSRLGSLAVADVMGLSVHVPRYCLPALPLLIIWTVLGTYALLQPVVRVATRGAKFGDRSRSS